MYEITPINGESHKVTGKHRLQFIHSITSEIHTMTIDEYNAIKSKKQKDYMKLYRSR